jgi:hypothetical protein
MKLTLRMAIMGPAAYSFLPMSYTSNCAGTPPLAGGAYLGAADVNGAEGAA